MAAIKSLNTSFCLFVLTLWNRCALAALNFLSSLLFQIKQVLFELLDWDRWAGRFWRRGFLRTGATA
jgi:hypothetical protein